MELTNANGHMQGVKILFNPIFGHFALNLGIL